MTRQLIIVRTHRADDASLAAYDRFAKLVGSQTIFCVDERAAPADMGGRAKLAFNEATLDAMGLYAHHKSGWRCGDYFYYVARRARPDFDFYWLIEPDVRINTPDPDAFFALFAASNADFLAPQLGPRDALWGWTRTILPVGLPPRGCLFPITRLSGRAIDHLYTLRRTQSADLSLATQHNWPNDEVFTATMLGAGDFLCSDLKDIVPDCYTAETLAVTAVVDFDLVSSHPPDHRIYHPVRDFAAWLTEAEARIARLLPGPGPMISKATRADASFIGGVAQSCARHPLYREASVVPQMVAEALWTQRPWASASPSDQAAADTRQASRSTSCLARQFGVTKARPLLGTLHLATCQQAPQKPAAEDFTYGPAFKLGHFPRQAAIPYAFDRDRQELILTLHLRPEAVLNAPCQLTAQRETSRVVARLPTASLPAIYGASLPQLDAYFP